MCFVFVKGVKGVAHWADFDADCNITSTAFLQLGSLETW